MLMRPRCAGESDGGFKTRTHSPHQHEHQPPTLRYHAACGTLHGASAPPNPIAPVASTLPIAPGPELASLHSRVPPSPPLSRHSCMHSMHACVARVGAREPHASGSTALEPLARIVPRLDARRRRRPGRRLPPSRWLPQSPRRWLGLGLVETAAEAISACEAPAILLDVGAAE